MTVFEPCEGPDASGLLKNVVREAVELRATDIHLEREGETLTTEFRVDGELQLMGQNEGKVAHRVPTLVKHLAGLKTYVSRQPQDGEIDGDEFGLDGRMRVSVYPTVDGEKVALRIFDRQLRALDLSDLRLPRDYTEELKRQLMEPDGLLLFTGPAGSGKTTTIYASIRYLLEQGRTNIVTIEDPVEVRLPGVTQTTVDPEAELDYPDALRGLLRQDPEVIAVGEIRDELTAEITLRAAFTGHMGLSAIHAGSVVGVFDRLSEMDIEPFLLTSALSMVTAQRLVRRLCERCEGGGCEECLDTGYRGRLPLVEFAIIDEEVGEMIRTADDSGSIEEFLREKKDFHTLGDRASELVNRGWTTDAEIQRLLGCSP